MFPKLLPALLVPTFFLSTLAQAAAQVDLTSVGPLTELSTKSTICNILDYGGVADNSTDVGPAISLAFTSCASSGGATIYIPPGTYSLQTGVKLNKGSAYAMQIDGLIILTSDGSFSGNAFVISNANDVEVFSSNGLGAINGQGYITRITGSGQNARLFRFISCTDISFHDIILVDSPTFHLIFNGVSNMEAYHITIRGPSMGGTDGIDIDCTDNCYIHDSEVTNRDECVSVKSPSNNILIEEMYCNQSGGMSIGSLTADGSVDTVSNVTMRGIYIFQCTQMLMIKTFPGGTGATGYVKDSLFENFWAYDTTYALDIDQYWESHTTPDTGAVALSGLTFNNWTGSVDNGVSRGAIVIRGSDIVPLTDITLSNFDMWTVNNNRVLNQCKNVYGTGYCAATSTAGQSLTTFTTTVTSTAAPAAYTAPISPAWGIPGYGTSLPIPVYTPAVMWSPASPNGVSGTSSSTNLAMLSKTSSSVSASTTEASTKSSVSPSLATSTTKASTEVSITSLLASTNAGAVKSSSVSVLPSSSSVVSKASSFTKVAVTSSTTSSKVTTVSVPLNSSTSAIKLSSSSNKTTLSSNGNKTFSTLITSTKPIITISTSTSAIVTPSSAGLTIEKWGQCGGQGWSGTGSCVSGSDCVVQNPWYSQCLEDGAEDDEC